MSKQLIKERSFYEIGNFKVSVILSIHNASFSYSKKLTHESYASYKTERSEHKKERQGKCQYFTALTVPYAYSHNI